MKNLSLRRNNLFDIDLFDGWDNFFRPITREKAVLPSDIRETEKEYILDISVPGYDKSEIEVSISDGYLRVRAEKKEINEENNNNYIHRERIFSKVERNFYVGDVDKDNIKALCKDGVLTLTIPKEQDKPKENNIIAIE